MEQRVIKFRAWDSKNNLMYMPDTSDWEMVHMALDGIPHEASFYGYYQTLNRTDSSEYITLMQFTGLTDKNGKEIYEGDIVRYWTSVYGDTPFDDVYWEEQTEPVVYSLDCFCLDAKYPLSIALDDEKGAEVIGNIYENPELLK